MRILMLGGWAPVPRRGEELGREMRVARHLARSHRLTLAFVTDEGDPSRSLAVLREEFGDLEFTVIARGWKRMASAFRLAAGESCTLAYRRVEALHTRLRDRVRASHFDVAYVSSSGMIPYALALDGAIPVVMDFGDVDSAWWLRQAERRSMAGAHVCRMEGLRLRSAEEAVAMRARRVIVASPQAGRHVAGFGCVVRPTIVPNGIDPGVFSQVVRLHPAPALLFLSPIESDPDAAAAARFCLAALPAIRARVPEARIMIPASIMTPSVRRLGHLDGVVVEPPGADWRGLLHRATAGVAPLPAASPSLAVVEAMATGLPVVTTHAGCEGLDVEDGHGAFIRDSAPELAHALAGLLENPQLCSQMSAHAAAHARTRRSWDAVMSRLDSLLEEAVAAAPPPADARHHEQSRRGIA